MEKAPGAMASSYLPNFISLKPIDYSDKPYVIYSGEYVACKGPDVHSPSAKIEVERGKTNPDLVHLRFCGNNRYWARQSSSISNPFIYATSNQPEEDTSRTICTLFRPTVSTNPTTGGMEVTFHDTKLGWGVQMSFGKNLFVETATSVAQKFAVTDWDSLVILPNLVTFKGDTDKYLKSCWIDGHPYLQFSGDDGNTNETTYEVQMASDGTLSIKSSYFGKFWRRSPNWIWGDSTATTTKDTMFRPVKIDDHTIALRNLGNNLFCKRLDAEGKTSCLNASADTAVRYALLAVQEPVSSRDIYNVRYRLQDARIYDEEPFIAGGGSATNQTGKESSLGITVSYEDKHSYSLSNSWSLTAGVSYTFKFGVPAISKHEISVSSEVTKSWEWSETTEDTRTSSATYTAVVPPWTSIRVNYVGTKATCNVPFSYTKRVRLSTSGDLVATEHTDGVFIGVNAYNYHFDQVQQSRL